MAVLADMIARTAQAGHVTWIGLRPARRDALVAVQTAEVTVRGLVGDHAASGKRAVTFLQAEHLAAIGSFLGSRPVTPFDLRRNIVVSGINLAALKGRSLHIGTAELRITGICAPCSRMEEGFGPGGYSAVRGHGGWCAEVLDPGTLSVGDPVVPMDTDVAAKTSLDQSA